MTFKSGIAVGFFLGAMSLGFVVFFALFIAAPLVELFTRFGGIW
jgi:hypothetical protein